LKRFNSNKQEIETFVGRELKSELESETAYVAGQGPPIFSLLIETKEGIMKAFKGDWIIKEPFPTGDRDFYPCKPDILKKTYDVFGNGSGSSAKVIEDQKILYDMKLHQVKKFFNDNMQFQVVRVPGGWLYDNLTMSGTNTVFVPFHPNKEF
jgi:hypothetical protein